jgi:hypothetical protein
MQHLNVRLAQANGMNARLCHMAKDRIMKLEYIIRSCHAAALPDPNDERDIELRWLIETILEKTSDV